MPLSCLKCSHSRSTAFFSCFDSASSSCKAKTRRNRDSVCVVSLFASLISLEPIAHVASSCGMDGWFSMNCSLFSRLPKGATKNAKSFFCNFSSTLAVAELLFETTKTVLPCRRILEMILSIVCVFPVPGGP